MRVAPAGGLGDHRDAQAGSERPDGLQRAEQRERRCGDAITGALALPAAVLGHEISEFIVIGNGLRMLRT